MKLRVLVACEFSGVVRRAFRALGHDAWSCDLLSAEDGSEHHYRDSIFHVLAREPWRWDLMIAHPECTRLTNAGVRWLTGKPPKGKTKEQMWTEFEDGVKFYNAVRAAPVGRKCIENPIFHCYAEEKIKPAYRQFVQPWWFGDPKFKATGFELINLPDLVATNKLVPPAKGTKEHKEWSSVHREPPGPERKKNRSRFFPGIAEAMAVQWSEYIISQKREAA